MSPDLQTFDRIVLHCSGGKDSQAMLDYVVELADIEGIDRKRLVMVYADMRGMEWPGTMDLVREQAGHYGLRLEVERAINGDLIDRAVARKRWPRANMRWCTSNLKLQPMFRAYTRLSREAYASGEVSERPVRFLACRGTRAEESKRRARLQRVHRERYESRYREIWNWLPIHDWTISQVWERVQNSGLRHHPAYDMGATRVSCAFCITAPRSALLLAGEHNPDLLDRYVAAEQAMGCVFRDGVDGQSLREVRDALAAGERAGVIIEGDER